MLVAMTTSLFFLTWMSLTFWPFRNAGVQRLGFQNSILCSQLWNWYVLMNYIQSLENSSALALAFDLSPSVNSSATTWLCPYCRWGNLTGRHPHLLDFSSLWLLTTSMLFFQNESTYVVTSVTLSYLSLACFFLKLVLDLPLFQCFFCLVFLQPGSLKKEHDIYPPHLSFSAGNWRHHRLTA